MTTPWSWANWSIPFAEVESARLYEPLRPLRRAQVLEIPDDLDQPTVRLSRGSRVEEVLPFEIERDARRPPRGLLRKSLWALFRAPRVEIRDWASDGNAVSIVEGARVRRSARAAATERPQGA